MKQKTILMMSLCLFFALNTFSQTLTEASTNTGWQAYKQSGSPPTGVPYDWQVEHNPTPGDWGQPIQGDPSEYQENLFNSRFGISTMHAPPVSNGCGSGSSLNFIHSGPPAGSPTKGYFRYELDLTPDNSCAEYHLIYNADDKAEVWVNGHSVGGTNAWEDNGDAILSKHLVCGKNIITVEVTQTNGSCIWFIGKIVPQALPAFDNELTSSILDCNPSPSNVSLHAPTASSYSWTGPNGYTASVQNPTVIGDPSNNGIYTCVYTIACCTRTATIDLTIPTSCCDASINIIESDCSYYLFGVGSSSIQNACARWEVDGVVEEWVGSQLDKTFTPGSHTVCANYLSDRDDDSGEICCERVCRTINVLGNNPTNEAITIVKCESIEFGSFDPCGSSIPQSTPYYSIQGPLNSPDDGYDSRIGKVGVDGLWTDGCNSMQVVEGTYIIKYFDANGCLTHVVVLTVNNIPC